MLFLIFHFTQLYDILTKCCRRLKDEMGRLLGRGDALLRRQTLV